MAVVKTQYPSKLYYKINEVSRITGLKPYVLRYWETEFEELNPQKDVNEQRRYRVKDIDLIQRIKKLLYEERFTIAGAKKKLKSLVRSKEDQAAYRRDRIKAISKDLVQIREDLNALIQRYA